MKYILLSMMLSVFNLHSAQQPSEPIASRPIAPTSPLHSLEHILNPITEHTARKIELLRHVLRIDARKVDSSADPRLILLKEYIGLSWRSSHEQEKLLAKVYHRLPGEKWFMLLHQHVLSSPETIRIAHSHLKRTTIDYIAHMTPEQLEIAHDKWNAFSQTPQCDLVGYLNRQYKRAVSIGEIMKLFHIKIHATTCTTSTWHNKLMLIMRQEGEDLIPQDAMVNGFSVCHTKNAYINDIQLIKDAYTQYQSTIDSFIEHIQYPKPETLAGCIRVLLHLNADQQGKLRAFNNTTQAQEPDLYLPHDNGQASTKRGRDEELIPSAQRYKYAPTDSHDN